METLLVSINPSRVHRPQGTAVYLTANEERVPSAMAENLKHNQVLHEQAVLLTVETARQPRVPEAERGVRTELARHLARVRLRFGFAENPEFVADERDVILFGPFGGLINLGFNAGSIPMILAVAHHVEPVLRVVLAKLVAEPQAALGDGPDSSPFAVAHLERRPHETLSRKIAGPGHHARVLVLHAELARLEFHVQEARGTMRALQAEPDVAQRIVENVRQFHARAVGDDRKTA